MPISLEYRNGYTHGLARGDGMGNMEIAEAIQQLTRDINEYITREGFNSGDAYNIDFSAGQIAGLADRLKLEGR